MAVKDVEVRRRDEGIAEGVLLPESRRARRRVVPGPPLVDREANLLGRIALVHDRRMALDQLFDAPRLGEGGEPLGCGEPDGRALMRPVASRNGVIMQPQDIHLVVGLHHLLGPRVIVSRCPDSEDLGPAILPDEGAEDPQQRRVLIGAEIASAAPHLVADPHVIDLPRPLASVRTAQLSQARIAW